LVNISDEWLGISYFHASPEFFTFAIQNSILILIIKTHVMKKYATLKPIMMMLTLTLWLSGGNHASAQVTIPDYSTANRKDIPKN